MPLRQPLTFTLGDQVVVTHRSHPHWGESGQIVADFSHNLTPDLRWTVENQLGERFAVAEREIKRV